MAGLGYAFLTGRDAKITIEADAGLVGRVLESMRGYRRFPALAAVFVDRDGVINVNRSGFVASIGDLEFLPHAVTALVRLSKAGNRVFVVTNQAAVGRGQLSPVEAWSINQHVVDTVTSAGGRIAAVLMCSHRPEHACTCRKPQPGLLRIAQQQYGVDLRTAYLVGDHWSDIVAGAAVGCTTILALSGRWRETAPNTAVTPGHVVPDLARAVGVIVNLEARRNAAEPLPIAHGLAQAGGS